MNITQIPFRNKIQVTQLKYLKFLLIFLALITFVLLSSSFAMFSHDDPTNMIIFRTILSDHGLVKALWMLFINFDFRSFEYRPFWLSRTLHFFLFHIFGLNPFPYAIIMSTLHFLSGLIIYLILESISKSKEVSFFSAVIWILTPFSAPLFVFHHFSYQVIPIYFFLLYTYLSIKYQQIRQFWMYLLIFCMTFSGEQSLPLLFTLLFILCINDLLKKRYSNIKNRILQGLFALFLLFFHATLLSKLPTDSNQHQRRFYFFSIHSLTEIKIMIIQWLNEQVLPNYYQILSIFSSDYAYMKVKNISLVIWIVLLIIILIGVIFFLFFKEKNDSRKHIIKCALLVILFSINSFLVYAYLFVMSGGGGYFPRYTFFTGTSMLVGFIIILYSAFYVKIARVFSFLVVTYTVSLFVITNVGLKPIIYDISKNIDLILTEGRSQGKKAVLIAHNLRYPPRAETHYWWGIPVSDNRGVVRGLINMYYTNVQNSYKYFYSLDRVITDFYGYEMTSYHNFNDTKEGIELIGCCGNKKTYNSDEILVIGNKNSWYSYQDSSVNYVNKFENWTDFLHSSSYKGVIIFSSDKRYPLSQNDLLLEPDAIFDLGNKVEDIHFNDNAKKNNNTFSFGFLDGQDINNPTEKIVHPSGYWISNRAGEFTYQISSKKSGEYWVVFDFLELWQSSPGKRFFSIELSTDNYSQIIGPFDLSKLGGFQQPLSVATWISDAQNLTIKTIQSSGSEDIPFISGIRLYKDLGI